MAESANSSSTENTTSSSSGSTSSGSSSGGFSFSGSLESTASSLKDSLAPSVSFGGSSGSSNDFSFGANVGWVPTVSAPGSSSSSSSSSGSRTNVATGQTYNSSSGKSTISDKSALETILKVDDVWSTDSSDSSTDKPTINRTSDSSGGDYQAFSNEKSEVKTSTLGKQSDIVTDPTLTSENKGLVDNSTIDSVEGLMTKQKDKASQEVLDASKKRFETEEEDKTDRIKNQLTKDGDAIDTAYKDLDSKKSKEVAAKQQTLNQRQKELDEIGKERDLMQKELDSIASSVQDQEKYIKDFEQEINALVDDIKEANTWKNWRNAKKETDAALDKIDVILSDKGLKVNRSKSVFLDETLNSIEQNKQEVLKSQNDLLEKVKWEYDLSKGDLDDFNNRYNEALSLRDAAQKDFDNISKSYNTWKGKDLSNSLRSEINNITTAYNNGEITAEQAVTGLEQLGLMDDYNPFGFNTSDMVYLAGGLDGSYLSNNPSRLGEYTPPVTMEESTVETPTTMEEIVTESMTEPTTDYSLTDAANNLRQTYQGEEWAEDAASRLEGLNSSQDALREAVKPIMEKGLENCTPDEIANYIEAQENYNNNLKSALNNGKAYQQHDFNKDFVRSVAQANDFDVTLPDGSTMSYSKFATDMVVKSPKIASAMYENKANNYEKDGRKVLATIERAKAKMVQTWAGSKLALADNKVRDQFNQMADTNMRATYAAYNNVLKDPEASDAMKAEASEQISQAKSLKTASTALKATTGFFSGIGDSHSDGIYGTVNPAEMNMSQKIITGVNTFSQVVLGLGVSPAANKAYQNLYYLNPDYMTNENSILAKDFDKDGFAWVEEYGNNAAAGMILAGAELATGVALMFSPATMANGTKLIIDSVDTFMDSLYGVRGNAVKSSKMTEEVLSYFKDAENLNGLPTGATQTINNAIVQIENFELKADEVANLDNWLEGSGSNTAENGKFNQSLSYDEWLKLIESDETLRNYAKSLVDKKKEETV